MRKVILSLVAVLPASCAFTNGADLASQASTRPVGASRETRNVAFELREGDRVLGQPTITTRLGTPASITVAGGGGYKLNFTVEPNDTGARYLLRSSLYRAAGDGWTLVASPSMTVAEGQQSSITINRMPVPITMSVRVR